MLMKEIEPYVHSDVLISIIVNKCDLEERRKVFFDERNDFFRAD
jgi:hypothetical protein